MASLAQLHAELIGFLRQHCPVHDQRHLVLLAWMVAALLLSETVCFDRWKTRLPLGYCLAASWQRRCQRWLANSRIDVQALYGPLILWAIQHWQKPGHTLHLALDTTVLWNRFCVVVVSVVVVKRRMAEQSHFKRIRLLLLGVEHPHLLCKIHLPQYPLLAVVVAVSHNVEIGKDRIGPNVKSWKLPPSRLII